MSSDWKALFVIIAFFAPIISIAFPYVTGSIEVNAGQQLKVFEIKYYVDKYEIYIGNDLYDEGSYPTEEDPSSKIAMALFIMVIAIFAIGSKDYSGIGAFIYIVLAIYAVYQIYSLPENIAMVIASRLGSGDVISIKSSLSSGSAILGLGALAYLAALFSEE